MATGIEPATHTAGLILAGGGARRFGGKNKAMLKLGNTTLLERVISALSPQCLTVGLSCGATTSWAKAFRLHLIPDVASEAGPLGGIAAGLLWARDEYPDITHVLSVPVDCPFLPADLTRRLSETVSGSDNLIAVCASDNRRHSAAALWPVTMAHELLTALKTCGDRAVHTWQNQHNTLEVKWPIEELDPFFNVNSVEDLSEAAKLLGVECASHSETP